MWKPITDAQKQGRETWYVSSWNWLEPQNAFFEPNDMVWLLADSQVYARPTHYWDFGLDTPLPPPPKEGE